MATLRSLGRRLGITISARVAELLQGLIVMPIVIRLSGPAVYGSFVLLMSAVGFCMLIVDVGISYRYQRRLISTLGGEARRALFEPQFTFQVLAVALISALVLVVTPYIENSLFMGEVHVAAWPVVALLWCHLLYMQAVCYCLYSGRYTAFNLAWSGAPYVFLAVLVGAASVGLTLSVSALLALQAIATFCATVPLLPIVLGEIGIPRLRLPFRVLLEDARLAAPVLLQRVANDVLRFADRYLILAFLSVAAVGRYQPAFAVGSVVMAVPSVLGTVLAPTLSKMFDRGERQAAERLHAAALRIFLMVAVPFAIGTLMLGPSLLAVLTTTEIGLAGCWVMPLVAAGSLFLGMTRLLGEAAFVLTRTRAILGATLVAAGIDIVVNSVALPVVKDISVSAVVMLVGHTAGCLYLWRAIRDEWRVEIDWRVMLRFGAAGAAMGAVLWALGYWPATVSVGAPVTLIGIVILGVLVYFLLLSALGAFGRRELDDLIDVIQGPPIDQGADAAVPS